MTKRSKPLFPSAEMTRSDIAAIYRSIEDLAAMVKKLEMTLLEQGCASANEAEALSIAKKFMEIKIIKEQLAEQFDKINSLAPNSRHGNAKLNDREVAEIRGLYKSGLYSQEQLAKYYNVNQSAISKIVNKKSSKPTNE